MQFTMERSDTQLRFLDVLINKDEINFSEYLFKNNGLKKICLLQIKPPEALLKKVFHLLPFTGKDSLKENKLKEPGTFLTLVTN